MSDHPREPGGLREDNEALRRRIAALESEARRFKTTLYSIGDAVIATDAASVIVQMNPVAEALTGWSEVEARGRTASEVFNIVNEETGAKVESPVTRVLREGVVVGLANHTLLIAKDGKERPIANSGAPIRNERGEVTGVVLVFRDQTQERRAERDVRSAEKLFKTFFDNAPIGKCMTAPDGKLLRVNPAFGAMLGYSVDELQSISFATITHADDLAESRECVRALLADERNTWDMEKRYLAKDGHSVWTRVTTRLQRDDRGKPLHFLTHIQDVTERKLAEDALRESEQENALRAELLRKAPVIAAFHDRDQNIVWANKAYEEATGLSLQVIAGKKCYSVWNLPGPCNGCPVLTAIATGKPCEAELTPQNQEQWPESQGYWLSKASPVRDKEGRIIGAIEVAIDITARKRMEEELRRAFEELSHEKHLIDAIVNSMPGIFYTLDFTGRFVRWNANFERITGYGGEELAAMSALALFEGEDQQHIADAMQEVAEKGEAMVEAEILNKAGRGTPYLFTGMRAQIGGAPHLIGMGIDITERRRAEESLGQHVRELSVRNAIAEVFLSVSDEEMYSQVLTIILDAFESKYGVFGYIDEAGALVVPTMTQTIWDQCQVADKSTVFPRESWSDSIWPNAIRTKKVLHSNERSTRTPQGHVPIDRVIAAPIVHRGQVVGLFEVANKESDYDEADLALARTIANTIAPILDARMGHEREQRRRRSAEQDLQDKADALARSNQELEQFSYVASHDLQEPLRMVSSFTQLLAKRYQDQLDQDAKDFIGYAVDGANRMQRLIQDLLEYSRVTSRGQPTIPLDSHDALGLAVNSLKAAIQESGALVTNDELPSISGDRTQLAQVFQNLIGNAIKFQKPGEPPRVHVSAERNADRPDFWTFKVADNGIGIEPRHFERLFVIFQRLHGKQEYPGTGIGLALCKRIVERHGGTIWLESQAGTGTTFFFTLPSAERGKGVLP